MTATDKLMAIKTNIRNRGEAAMENSRTNILKKYNDQSFLSQALQYFAKVTLNNALPVFPALISISYEAAKGKLENTTPFGESIVLISAAADLHDDVIDNSTKKRNKKTVLGKFGSTITILAGDVLLVDGIKKLSESVYEISDYKATAIMKLVSDSIFEICCAEILESKLRKKQRLSPQRYEEVIRLKSVVPEMTMKVGAIIGNGESEFIEKMGEYGRSYGVISAIVEEFADLLEINELQNRLKNECPPLPIIYALQDIKNRKILNTLLNNQEINKDSHEKIVDLVLESKHVIMLQKSLISNAKTVVQKLPYINKKVREELENMLLVPLNYFE
ncbi:MAG: polyprenyl synthetase family protein [Candidatus Bathyarchaeota archaeon]|nr:polyprenyl synthetase family protein [Candidatus Bathyarchaeota archaeon]MDD4326422.1 polyprenyl synthetase family protein [Candidatus Bathyarchaeota archaeon]